MKLAVALGSNQGDSSAILRSAISDLGILGEVVAVSSLYRTAPVGGPGQAHYLNAVAVVDTELPARQVLDILHGIETRHGRIRTERWGPRTLDLDLIVSDQGRIDGGPDLIVPHPRALERRFVLEPLAEVWPLALLDEVTASEGLAGVLNQDVTRVPGRQWHAAAGRGGWWVLMQGVLFAGAIAAAVFDQGSAGGGSYLPWIGAALLVGGGLEMVFGVRALGSNLTAYPEPLSSATLITTGVYRRVRHPLYGANVLLITGLAAFLRSWIGLGVAATASVFFWAKAGHEEKRLTLAYPEYDTYRARTPKRLIPWIL